MIRALAPHEVHFCVEGGKAFFAEGKIPGGFVPEVFVRHWQETIDMGGGVIMAAFDGEEFTGALGAVKCPNPFNGKLMAVEMFWFVLPGKRGHGLRLLDAFENWAEQIGVQMVAMIHLEALSPATLEKLYVRRGYKLVERNYIKEID